MTATPQPRDNPYVGPRAFEQGDPFYGRDREVMELLDLLIAERIVLLYSRSGVGKTCGGPRGRRDCSQFR